MLVVENRQHAAVFLEDFDDLTKEFVAGVLSLAEIVAWVLTVFTDDQDGVDCQTIASATQRLRDAGINLKAKFRSALSAEVIGWALVDVCRDQL